MKACNATLPWVIASLALSRLSLAAHGCCAAWSYAALLLLISTALLWSALCFGATSYLLAATAARATPAADRAERSPWIETSLLAVLVAAVGGDALWALGDDAPLPGMAVLLHAGAVGWVGACGLLLMRGRRKV